MENTTKQMMAYDAKKKSAFVGYFLVFLFFISAHRFYFGKWFSAILQALLFWASLPLMYIGLWVDVDASTNKIFDPKIVKFFDYVYFAPYIWIFWILFDLISIGRWTSRYNLNIIKKIDV